MNARKLQDNTKKICKLHDYEVIKNFGKPIGRRCKNCNAKDNLIHINKLNGKFIFADPRT